MKPTRFKILYILFFCLSFAFFGSQCKKVSNGPSGSDTTGQRVSFGGYIFDVYDANEKLTGDYSGITVKLSGNINSQSNLDNNEEFLFKYVPSGIYLLTASKPGYPDMYQYIKVLATQDSGIIYEMRGTGINCNWIRTSSASRQMQPTLLLSVPNMFLVTQPINNITSLHAKAVPTKDSIEVSADIDSNMTTWPGLPVLFLISYDPDVSNSHFIVSQEIESYHGHAFYNFNVNPLVSRFGFKHGQVVYISACIGAIPAVSYINNLGHQVYWPVSSNYPTQQVVIP